MSWLTEKEMHRDDYNAVMMAVGMDKDDVYLATHTWRQMRSERYEEESYMEVYRECDGRWDHLWGYPGVPRGDRYDDVWDYLLSKPPGSVTEAEIKDQYDRCRMEELL